MSKAGGAESLIHDFSLSADTSAGAAGTPQTGPGGAWGVTGPSGATVRVSGGKLIADGLAYLYKLLDATPGRIRHRFVWRTGGSATAASVSGQTGALSIVGIDMVHVSVTGTFISLTVWNAGVSGIPSNNGNATNGAVALVSGREYELDCYIKGNVVTASVYDVLTGDLMGRYTGSDSLVSTKAGPMIYIEPTDDTDLTYVSAHADLAQALPFRLVSTGGFGGPIGVNNPDQGLFSRVGIGTQVPTTDFHLVSVSNTVGLIESTHASGANLRVRSTTTGAVGGSISLGTSTIAEFVKIGASNAVTAQMQITIDSQLVATLTKTGRLSLTGAGNDPWVDLTAAGSTLARIKLTSGSSTTAEVYQGSNASDLRLKTGGSDRIRIGSAGELHFSGSTPVAKQTVSGSRGGNAALADLLTKLAAIGLITDGSSA